MGASSRVARVYEEVPAQHVLVLPNVSRAKDPPCAPVATVQRAVYAAVVGARPCLLAVAEKDVRWAAIACGSSL